jgi:hypothetical protein
MITRIVGMHYPALSEARASVVVNLPDVMAEVVLAADYRRRTRAGDADARDLIMENLTEAERLLVKVLGDVRAALDEQRRNDPQKTKVIFVGEKT